MRIKNTKPMAAEIETLLTGRRRQVARLCRDLAVRSLHVFGSAVSGKFDPNRSDLDVMADFADHDKPGIADRYLTLAEGLEKIFDRPVDLLTVSAIKNPYFQREIKETGRLIYAA